MSRPGHTYGPTCHLARTVTFSGSKGDDDMPILKAQFFYASPLPIDDPLSVIPPPTGSDSTVYPPRPFSAYDNNALEEEWLGLASEKHRKLHNKGKTVAKTGRWMASRRASAAAAISTKLEQGARKMDQYAQAEGLDTVKAEKNQDSKGGKHAATSDAVPVARPSSVHAKDKSGQSEAIVEKKKESKNRKKTGEAETDEIPGPSVIHSSGRPDSWDCPCQCSHEDCQNTLGQCPCQTCPMSSHSPQTAALAPPSPAPECCSDIEGEITDREGEGYSSQDASGQRKAKKGKGKSSRSKSKLDNHVSISDLARNQGDASDDGYFKAKSSHSGKGSKTTKLEGSDSQGQGGLSTQPSNISAQGGDAGTTGRPFLKYSSRSPSPQPQAADPSTQDGLETSGPPENTSHRPSEETRRTHERDSTETEQLLSHGCKAHKHGKELTEVPVGISRLHSVKLPTLQMKPIYWLPVHDVSAVTRGTWFYRDSMYPVEPAVANQLEMGYRELRPWSQTWNDELNSALEVGAAGEEKIAHRLWPRESDPKGSILSHSGDIISADPHCAARCFQGEAAAEGTVDPEDLESKPSETRTIVKKYSQAQVIYKDSQNAFILKPALQPSAYYGRKPLQKIKRGITVGLHVIRGFDWSAWEKIHPTKKSKSATKAEETAPVADDANAPKRNQCTACRTQEERPNVSDLVLVIHGIGQKLSERVESFHFTHAINSFRRSINVELGNEAVRRVIRKDMGGLMILPVNWRSTLSFEDGGPMKDGDKASSATDFSLKDITPNTIPAVRNLISDVMLDIPFYMSHHKPKMISAVINEANRVYHLWCKNNVGFHQKGRVHIIAHSLGSAMAVEILSKQPTLVPKNELSKRINSKHFDFNTTNLFCVGSPAGFFLLLDKGNLCPRRGQSKPGAEQDGADQSICGKAGSLGCVAVDNIYNVMHYNDPIAYRLNATVDPLYAESLKIAQVPSATAGFFETIGNAMKSITPGMSTTGELGVGQVAKPTGPLRLPSQLEMAVHDFSREDMAEKKFFLLNDNGQVDWFLSSGGGPLEFQYINMLGAHSSYWGSADFIRMVVTEVGRKPGRESSLPNMRAAKIGYKAKAAPK